MTNTHTLKGIYAASITPFDEEGYPALHLLPPLLRHLEANGCHGTLILGTTGEGPSLSVEERISVLRAAAAERGALRLLAGTGAASLSDAMTLTRAAFDLGYDGVVVLPPFYYKKVAVDGLYTFYHELLTSAVPSDGRLLLYHIPQISNIPIEADLIRRLRDSFPNQVAGIKDSSESLENLLMLCKDFEGFQVFSGDDSLLADALEAGGAGAITGLSNAFSRQLRDVFDAHQDGLPTEQGRDRLKRLREKSKQLGISPIVTLKAILRIQGIIPNDYVRPPLCRLNESLEARLRETFAL